jgi:pseudaminic acid cytidylyltransferase
MKCIAIITARGGSKRIPRKNIKPFLGEPIISYSIRAAILSNCFDEVMVSTDDLEIAEYARSIGASVPFFRSEQNSNDFATTSDVINEVLNAYEEKGHVFEYCCCIYPTAPFITSKKLKEAYTKLINQKVDSVIPIVRFSFPIMRSFKIENDKISFNWPEYELVRSQDIPPAFHDSGQFYFIKVDSFKESNKLLAYNTIGIEYLESEVQDIDNDEDWLIAEIKYTAFLKKQNSV